MMSRAENVQPEQVHEFNRVVLEIADRVCRETPGLFVGDLFSGSKLPLAARSRGRMMKELRQRVFIRPAKRRRGTTYYDSVVVLEPIKDAISYGINHQLAAQLRDTGYQPISTPILARCFGHRDHSAVVLRLQAIDSADSPEPAFPKRND